MRRVLIALLVLAHAARADDRPQLAVLGVVAKESSLVAAAGTMTSAITARSGAKTSTYRNAGARKDIDAAVLAAECTTIQPACAAKLGAQLAADVTLAGELERRGTHQVLVLALVDVRTKQRMRTVREIGLVKGDAKKLALAAYTRLVEGEVGTLAIAANAPQGEVWIDGQLAAALFEGRTTVSGLPLGAHQLSVRARGYKPFDIDITVDHETKQALLLDPE